MKTNYTKDLDSAIRQLDGRVLNVLPKTQSDSIKELRILDSLAKGYLKGLITALLYSIRTI